MKLFNNVLQFHREINEDPHLACEFILIVNRDMDLSDPMSTVIILSDGYNGFSMTYTMHELAELVYRLGPDANWQGACYRAASDMIDNM